MIICEEKSCCPVGWNTCDVESVTVCYTVLRTQCSVIHCEIVYGLFTGFNHMIERLAIIEFNIDLSSQYVRITDRKSVVIGLIVTLVRIRPSHVSAATQIVREGGWHTDAWLVP